MGKINRHDLRLSDEMLADIEAIAEMNGAKVHHISKKPIIKDTVISLLELGIKAVFEGVDLPKKSDKFDTDNNNRIDLTVLDEKIEDKLKPLYSLISELTDKINRIANTNSNNDTDNINRIDLTVLTDNEGNTESIALSESPNLPVNEVLPQIVPETENEQLESDIVENDSKLDNLSDKEKEILEKMKAIESGTTFDSQSKLGDYLGLTKSEKPHLSKLKDLWVDKLFSIDKVNGSNKLTRL